MNSVYAGNIMAFRKGVSTQQLLFPENSCSERITITPYVLILLREMSRIGIRVGAVWIALRGRYASA